MAPARQKSKLCYSICFIEQVYLPVKSMLVMAKAGVLVFKIKTYYSLKFPALHLSLSIQFAGWIEVDRRDPFCKYTIQIIILFDYCLTLFYDLRNFHIDTTDTTKMPEDYWNAKSFRCGVQSIKPTTRVVGISKLIFIIELRAIKRMSEQRVSNYRVSEIASHSK